MRIFCDMDGVLVRQTGRADFHKMPWMPDGKELWAFIAPLRPTILSMLRPDIYEQCAPQKKEWVRRELGPDIEVVVTPDRIGKGPYAMPGAVLIDDDKFRHRPGWEKNGGIYVHHTSAAESIRRLKVLL